MEFLKRKKRRKRQEGKTPWHRKTSLRGAVVFSAFFCVLGAFLFCCIEIFVFSEIYGDIYETYVLPHVDQYTGRISNDAGQVILSAEEYNTEQADSSQSTEPYISPRSLVPEGFLRFFYDYQGLLVTAAFLLTSLLAFMIEAFWIYRWKLKKPLQLLTYASDKIAQNDLDFSINPPSADELGRLCLSFEQMRSSLAENNRAMWKAMEERRRLNAAFAHDLRTPLTVLSGYSDYLLEGLPTGTVSCEKAAETISTMKRNIGRLRRYVEGMNSVQRLEEITPERSQAYLPALCTQLKETADILFPEGVCLFLPCEEPATLLLDSGLVQQVFENLLNNASRYLRTRVTVTCRTESGCFLLSVSDDGPGFSEEALEKAVQPYYRADKKAEDEHFGLGLTICRLLCEKHGGALTLENNEDGGARVTARFA